jgi:hypothetical protein
LVEELAPQCALNEAAFAALLRQHRGNVRDALRELYDRAGFAVKNGKAESG